jgi:hypothetical protein
MTGLSVFEAVRMIAVEALSSLDSQGVDLEDRMALSKLSPSLDRGSTETAKTF